MPHTLKPPIASGIMLLAAGISACCLAPAFATVGNNPAVGGAAKSKQARVATAPKAKHTASTVAAGGASSQQAGKTAAGSNAHALSKQASSTQAAGANSASGPACTNEEDTVFKLKVNVNNTNPGDSGVDVYRSLGAGDGAPAPVSFDRKFDMLVAPKVQEQTGQLDVAAAKKAAASVDSTTALQEAEASKVDWSGWAGQLADRWFGNLKNLEYTSHRGWTTDRPAMIQFTCHADGRITGIQLRQSCGNPAYDNMQIEALKRTIPAPAFPSGTHLTTYTLIQGWEAHPRHPGEQDYKPGSFGHNMPAETVPHKPVVVPPGGNAKKAAKKS